MIFFLDSSTLLSAAGSAKGAARFVILEAKARGWELVSSDYCAEETRRNLPKLGRSAATAWGTGRTGSGLGVWGGRWQFPPATDTAPASPSLRAGPL